MSSFSPSPSVDNNMPSISLDLSAASAALSAPESPLPFMPETERSMAQFSIHSCDKTDCDEYSGYDSHNGQDSNSLYDEDEDHASYSDRDQPDSYSFVKSSKPKVSSSSSSAAAAAASASMAGSYTSGLVSRDFEFQKRPPIPQEKSTKRWSFEENDRLVKAVNQYGSKNWPLISKAVGSRDNVQCRQRWQKVLCPGLHKGKWSDEEDARLLEIISASGEEKNWARVAEKIPGRTSKQCRERWCHHLAPTVNKGPFLPHEDQNLAMLYQRYGKQWSKIAEKMPGRTENMIRSRINYVKKAYLIQEPNPAAQLKSKAPSSMTVMASALPAAAVSLAPTSVPSPRFAAVPSPTTQGISASSFSRLEQLIAAAPPSSAMPAAASLAPQSFDAPRPTVQLARFPPSKMMLVQQQPQMQQQQSKMSMPPSRDHHLYQQQQQQQMMFPVQYYSINNSGSNSNAAAEVNYFNEVMALQRAKMMDAARAQAAAAAAAVSSRGSSDGQGAGANAGTATLYGSKVMPTMPFYPWSNDGSSSGNQGSNVSALNTALVTGYLSPAMMLSHHQRQAASYSQQQSQQQLQQPLSFATVASEAAQAQAKRSRRFLYPEMDDTEMIMQAQKKLMMMKSSA